MIPVHLRWLIEDYAYGTWPQRLHRALSPLRYGSTEPIVPTPCWMRCTMTPGEYVWMPRGRVEDRLFGGRFVLVGASSFVFWTSDGRRWTVIHHADGSRLVGVNL